MYNYICLYIHNIYVEFNQVHTYLCTDPRYKINPYNVVFFSPYQKNSNTNTKSQYGSGTKAWYPNQQITCKYWNGLAHTRCGPLASESWIATS